VTPSIKMVEMFTFNIYLWISFNT